MKAACRVVASALIAVCAPAGAQETIGIDFPAGSAGRQLLALGAVARISIVVRDRRLWIRGVPALRGRMTADVALQRIAAAARAGIVTLAPGSFQLVPRPESSPRRIAVRVARRPAPVEPVERVEPQDIVVTASKRGVALRNFAGQASWVSGNELDLGGAGGSDRLVNRLTSVASTYLGAGRNKLFIRGIADSSFTGATPPTVGQYFGDLRLNYTGPDPDLRLIDLAGVEVLEGPQGTLYGAGSLGGLIRLVPNAPDLGGIAGTLAAGASVIQHGAPGADIQGVLNLPLVADRIGLRLSAIADSEGGYIDKPLLGVRDANRMRTLGGRATIRLSLADGWTADLIGMGQRIRAADSQYTDGDGHRLSRASPVVESFDSDFTQAQLALAGAIGVVRVQATLGITGNDLAERYDATIADRPPRLFVKTNRTRMVAHETRLWRQGERGAGWLMGLSHVRNQVRSARLAGAPDNPLPTVGVTNRAEEVTLYGEASRRLLSGLLATGGVRISKTMTAGHMLGAREPGDPDAPLPLAGDAHDPQGRQVQTAILPSASLLVDVTDSTHGFLRYQRGFRPGGLAIDDDHLRRFRSDRVDMLEAGLRMAASGPLRADATMTLAYTFWQDIQADFLDRAGLPSTANIGDGRVLTFEITGGVRPARGLRVMAALSYNESSIGPSVGRRSRTSPDDAAPLPEGLSVQLDRIPNVAPLTGRLGATFERGLDTQYTLRVDTWVRYVGPSSLGIGPVLGQSQGDYIDSALTARLGKGPIGLTMGVTNLADARGNRFALGTPVTTGRAQVTPLRPRTLRVAIDATF